MLSDAVYQRESKEHWGIKNAYAVRGSRFKDSPRIYGSISFDYIKVKPRSL